MLGNNARLTAPLTAGHLSFALLYRGDGRVAEMLAAIKAVCFGCKRGNQLLPKPAARRFAVISSHTALNAPVATSSLRIRLRLSTVLTGLIS